MALSSMGHSQASAQSLQSITGEKEPGTLRVRNSRSANSSLQGLRVLNNQTQRLL